MPVVTGVILKKRYLKISKAHIEMSFQILADCKSFPVTGMLYIVIKIPVFKLVVN